MKVLIFTFVILIETYSISAESLTCAVFDFNDALSLNDFEDCSTLWSGNSKLLIESYSDSLAFSPFREESQYFLTTDKNVNSDITQCLSTKALYSGNFSSFSFQIGINLRNNNDNDQYNNVQLFISNILAFQITPKTNGWHLYERDYSLPNLGVFRDSAIGFKVRIGNNSDLAVEFIKVYDPQITDKDCVPLYASSTPPSEITTELTTTTQSEAPTPTPETEIPTSTESSTPDIEIPACFEADFNDPTSLLNTFSECNGQYLPELIIKSYANTTVAPYRSTSLFHLSNKWEGYSCLETSSIFSFAESSFLESVIFLNGVWPGAWIEVSVVDVQTGDGEILIRVEIENNWIRFYKEIEGKYSNAQIIIKTNMNAYSQLAVEYLNIRGDSC